MALIGTVTLGKWSEPKISPSGVHSFEAPLLFGKDRLTLKRSEYRNWEHPLFSLDYSEAVDLPASDSMIRKLDAAFRQPLLNYKLVDYGPLSHKSGKNESAGLATKTPWAKFWSRLT